MTQFQTIKFKGFEAQVTGYVHSEGWNQGLVYLEMSGAEAHVKAIWANLVSAETKRSGYADEVKRDGSSVRMEKHTKYTALRTVLDNGQICMALVHPQATVLAEGASFYLIAEADHEGPPANFFPRLARILPIPIKAEWSEWLWEEGLKAGEYDYQRLIKKCTSSGHVVGYLVACGDVSLWLQLVQRGLGFQICERCKKVSQELVEHKTIIGYGYGSHRKQEEKVEMLCPECHNPKREEIDF